MKSSLLLTAILALGLSLSLRAEDKPAATVKKPGAEKGAGAAKAGKPGSGNAGEQFANLLKQCDENKDGAVTKDEFLKNQPPGKDAAKSEQWFTDQDKDKDGKITKQDYVRTDGKKG